MAGCAGGGSDDSETQTMTTWMTRIPSEMNLNTWAAGYPWNEEWLFFEPVNTFFADGSIENELVENWEYDPEDRSMTVEFTDGWSWWNGDTLTAEDNYWYDRVGHLLNPETSDWEDIELVDEMTIVRYFKEDKNPNLVEPVIGGYLGEMIRAHRDKFKEWAEVLEDVDDDDERLEIQEQMVEEMPLQLSTVMDEGLGNGPYEITDFDEQTIYLELNDDHPYADEIGVPNLELILAQDDAIAQRIMGEDIDIGSGLVETHVGAGNEPDHLENIGTYDDTFMRNIKFYEQGPGQEHMRTLEVRRAIALVIDKHDISENYNTPSTPHEGQTGMPTAVVENWLDEGVVGDFIEYLAETDEDAAAELMQQAGYERDGDDWVSEDGESVELEFVLPERFSNIGRTVTDQLDAFGFTIDLNVIEGATYNDRRDDRIDWDMTIGEHGGLIGRPYYYFRLEHQHGNDMGEIDVVKEAIESGDGRSPYNGRQAVVEIPTEVGQEDLSGSTEEINLVEMYEAWGTAQTDEENQELTEAFSWWFNYYVPMIDLVEIKGGSFGNTRDFEFDTDNKDWETYRGDFRALKRGRVSPRSS